MFPADREALLETAREEHAPDWVSTELERLEPGRTYDNMQAVWEALGGGIEQRD